jgi:DNA processing protein
MRRLRRRRRGGRLWTRAFEELRQIQTLQRGDEIYPASLLELRDPPETPYLCGDPKFLTGRKVAIVGSRAATPVGRRSAERIARDLSEAGVTVVSGMALGIDGAAHRGALAGRGGTIAVLGAGPDRPYPVGNREIFDSIGDWGLLVSEFPPGELPRPYHFPRRNRIIAALSSAVVVVEAARKSGALITVDHALDLGREVFGVPGSIENPQAEGVHAMLRDGAHLLTSARDLLETMGWVPTPNEETDTRGELGPLFAGAEPSQKLSTPSELLERSLVDRVPRSLDELVDRSGLSPAKLLSMLTRLEMEGRIERGGEGWHTP